MRQYRNLGHLPEFVKQRKSQDCRVYHDHPQISACEHLPQSDRIIEIHGRDIATISGGQFKATVQRQVREVPLRLIVLGGVKSACERLCNSILELLQRQAEVQRWL